MQYIIFNRATLLQQSTTAISTGRLFITGIIISIISTAQRKTELAVHYCYWFPSTPLLCKWKLALKVTWDAFKVSDGDQVWADMLMSVDRLREQEMQIV